MSDRKLRADLIRLASAYPAHSAERSQLLDLVKQAEGEEQVPSPSHMDDSATYPATDIAEEKAGPLDQADATPQAKADVAGEFTQREFSELGDRTRAGDLGTDAKKAADFPADDIGEKVPGPHERDSDEPWMQGEFTQQENSELEQVQEKDQWGKVKAFIVRKAHANPELRKAALAFIAGCEKLPEGKMRDMCEKKDKSNDSDGKDSDGDGKDKDKAKSDGKMPKELLEKFKGKKAKEGDQAEQDQMYAKGYRYIIRFQGNKIPPIYVKSPSQAAKLIREDYPNEKNYKSEKLSPPKGKKAAAAAAAAAFKVARAEGKSNDECLAVARAAARAE